MCFLCLPHPRHTATPGPLHVPHISSCLALSLPPRLYLNSTLSKASLDYLKLQLSFSKKTSQKGKRDRSFAKQKPERLSKPRRPPRKKQRAEPGKGSSHRSCLLVVAQDAVTCRAGRVPSEEAPRSTELDPCAVLSFPRFSSASGRMDSNEGQCSVRLSRADPARCEAALLSPTGTGRYPVPGSRRTFHRLWNE